MHAAVSASHTPGTQAPPRIDVNSKDNLLLMATSRFCARREYDRLSMSQFKEAFYMLVEHVTDDTKLKLARFLSKHKNTPRQVALHLSLEPLNISTPMLRHSSTLGQLDMLRIVELKGEEYAAILATRPDLGSNLIRRMKKIESQTVREALELNYAIPEQTREVKADIHFADATQFVSTLSYRGEEVASPATQKAETHIESNTDRHTQTEAALLEAAARGGRIENTDAPDRSSDFTPEFGKTFERAARSGDRQKLINFIHQNVGLTLQTTLKILEDQSGDTLSVLMSANDVSAAEANRILMLTFPQVGLSVENARRSVNFYSRLNSESSRDAVNQWPKVATQAPQHRTYLQDTDLNRLQRTPTTHTQSTKTTEQERKTG